ncbi:MAG: UDP-N-acetylglucosamine 2-epimerase (non-hydrolyzing) [Thermodesulfobacteriota bacterium]|nr:UDP-N-acetylglucosamine 2-epimerase (non-hydrolyzing) [Thermodesulfobacteriota bacterium]
MKIMTVLGTRPEIIRLSIIIKKLDKYCDHILVHTGQNFDETLSKVFFDELELRRPDYYLGVKSDTFGEQIGKILIESEKIIDKVKPDKILILGDTNSGLVSIIAKRKGTPVYHMEAGNRCFDDRVPEEVNRRIIDHSSTIHLPYTHNSKENLLREGIEINRIYVIGNPIYEVIHNYTDNIEKSKIHEKLEIEPQKYFLVTMHREENVDIKDRLSDILTALDKIQKKYKMPVICSLHPRTENRIKTFGLTLENRNIHFLKPLGFFDFIALEKKAFCVITDSGTVQEECCIFETPNITIRDVTERPETIECGSNIIAGVSPEMILSCVETTISEKNDWEIPKEYQTNTVSSKVVKVILS